MSEQGWINFLHAEGVDDRVVVHGGATAVFPVGSLLQAASPPGPTARCGQVGDRPRRAGGTYQGAECDV